MIHSFSCVPPSIENRCPPKSSLIWASHTELIVSAAIVAEITDVLNRPKLRAKFPALTDTVVEQVIDLLSAAETVNPSDIPAVSRDPKDDIFLACAKAADAHYLVSEDQDLLTLDPYDDVRIVNALDFLNAISKPSE